MRRRKALRGALAGLVTALLAAVTSPAGAQVPCTGSSSGGQSFTLTTNMSGLNFAPASVSDYLSGWAHLPGDYVVTVSPKLTNRQWALCIIANAPTVGASKPVADLEWRLAGGSTWFPMSTTAAQVGVWTGARTVTMQFRMRLTWATDPPGLYNVGYTIGAI